MSEAGRDERLNDVIAECLRVLESGKAVDRERLLRDHPEIAADLDRFLANHARMERTVRSLGAKSPPERLPRPFGRYTLVAEIGRGGMGVVYRANDPVLKRQVALKMILAGRLASASDVERFRLESEAAAGLDHPGIVPIHEVGEEEGQHYFTMKLVEGGSLQEQLGIFREDARGAARLVRALSEAVGYALQRGILHRDLKPANVLLDVEGRPHITDFGLAKRLDGRSPLTTPGEVLGTLAYLAPELATGQARTPSAAVDVYGLGAILYSLLTGRAPFEGEGTAETLLKLREQEPADPRGPNPRVPAELAAVCLKCLEKQPARRYESAQALADELGNWLEGRPVQARPLGSIARAFRWSRRHPAIVALAVLAGMAGLLLLLWVEEFRLRQARREEVLQSNVYTARLLANTLQRQLEEWGRHVVRAAEEREFQDLAKPDDARGMQAFLDRLPRSPFVSWDFHDHEGRLVARSPAPEAPLPPNDRDYYELARKHPERQGLSAVHISGIYQSPYDRLYKCSISVPVKMGSGRVGVLGAAVTTHRDLGLPPPTEPYEVAVVGRVNTGEPRWLIMAHRDYTPGTNSVEIRNPRLSLFRRRDSEEDLPWPNPRQTWAVDPAYRDPVKVDGATWLAGFAQVGNTEFVIVVQRKE